MAASSVERILRLFARLEPHGVELPGKPPVMRRAVPLTRRRMLRVEGSSGQTLGHYRARCGAKQRQDHTPRPDVTQAIDIAGAAGMAGLDIELKALLHWICGDQREKKFLVCELASALFAEARWRKWDLADGDADRIAAVCLDWLLDADGCRVCNTNGWVLTPGGVPAECPSCRGSGHTPVSQRELAREWKMPETTLRRRYGPALHWAMGLLQGRASTILGAITEHY